MRGSRRTSRSSACFNSRTRVGCDGGHCSTLIPRGASGCFREPSLFLTRILIASRLTSFNLHTTNELQLPRTSRGFMIASGSRKFPHSSFFDVRFYSVSLLAFKPHLHEGHHSAPASVEICAHLCLSICAHLCPSVDFPGHEEAPPPFTEAGLHDTSRRRPTLAGPVVQLPSALQRFTSGFGTGPGGATVLWPPGFRSAFFS